MKSYYLKTQIINLKLLMFSIIVTLSLTSCSEDNMNQDDIVNNDNYYVNYIIKGNGPYGRFSNWSATTPDGTYRNSGYQTRSWDQTYGPVKKGFFCSVQIGDYIWGTPTIEIHVSKNEEPFALKEIVTGSSASYDIDF